MVNIVKLLKKKGQRYRIVLECYRIVLECYRIVLTPKGFFSFLLSALGVRTLFEVRGYNNEKRKN
jgi:hypothetical protein